MPFDCGRRFILLNFSYCFLLSGNAGDLGSIPGLGKSPGEGNSHLLQYSGLENSLVGGGWQATVLGVTKSPKYAWDSPDKNSGMDSHSLLQGLFPTQGSNPGLLNCRQILYHLRHQGSPVVYSRKLIIAFLCKLFAMQQISVQMHFSLLLPCHFLKDFPHQVSCEYQSFWCH